MEEDEDRARTVQKDGHQMAHLSKKIILVLVMLAIPAGPIAARADSTAKARAEAKKHFDRATELYEDGQVAEAVIELKRSYHLAPHHTILYNLGQAYATLAKPVEAVEALRRYLDEGGSAIKPARRAEVEQEIARQQNRIATLEIRGLPDGAVVTIDGDDIGKAPLGAPVRVGVGKHVVAATAVGYEPGEAKIEVAGEDSKAVDLKLAPRAGQPAAVAGAALGQGLPALPVAPEPAPPPEREPEPAPEPELAPIPALAREPAPTPPAPIPAPAPAPAEVTGVAPAPGGIVTSAQSSYRSGFRMAGIIAASAGAVGLVVGGILWSAAESKNDEAVVQWQTDQSQARSTRSDAESLATGANVCLIAGGVLVGVGAITTLLTFADSSPAPVALAPTLAPNFAGLRMKGVW
jgi:hypothetical protein